MLKDQLLETPIAYLKGVGPQRAEMLKKELSVYTFRDLISYYPYRYVDRTKFYTVREITDDLPFIQLRGIIEHIEIMGKGHGKRLVATFRDSSGTVELVWFKGYNWIAQNLKTEIEYVVFGKAGLFNGRYNLAHPEIEQVTGDYLKQLGSFEGVYSSTEKLKATGLDSNGIRKLQRVLISQLKPGILEESLSSEILMNNNLSPLFEALIGIHKPENINQLKKAEIRIKFDELFFIQLRLLKLKKIRRHDTKGFVFNKVGEYFNQFFHHYLPFALTEAQKKVIKEIHTDMQSGKQMNRLLQGDVGSGKTVVALLCMLLAIDNGFQAALMAPTEILAQQHYATFGELLKQMDLRFALLTGSTKGKARKKIHEGLMSGETKILIGTHALIEDTVKFKNLGLVVIDEQHRFGVEQRAKLHAKNINPPHMLIMTATPIPRTLAMTFYGDLDTSTINELPPGRKSIKTYHYHENKRLEVIGFMKQQIEAGRQIYVVYPLIQESEKMDYQNLQEGYDKLVLEFPAPKYQISIVHGKLANEQKEFEMQRFIKGETQIMVATTVIEVGVNIPNASVMVIESAERFGLSQLHQLRGRVGRGPEQSYCILMTGYKMSTESKLRMDTLVRSNDGFEISEVDLKLRGPGDIEGTVQSGVIDLKLANLAQDGQILQMARQAAEKLLDEDEGIEFEKNSAVKKHLILLNKNRSDWSKIG